MIEFAVHIPGYHELDKEDNKQGSWVLAVDHNSVLIAHEDHSLQWHPLDKCEFLQMTNPVAPMVVTAPEPLPVYMAIKPENGLVVPNRQDRRHPE